MKKLLFILIFVNTSVITFSQASEENKQSNYYSVPDSTQTLLTIEQLIKDAREGVDFISNDELIKHINANPKLILLDVRTKEEYDAGHLKGATWIERGIAEFTLARTLRDPYAEIIVYCLKRNRSALVAKTLKRMGYQNVKTHIGLEDWIKEGYSIYNFLGEVKVVKLREINAATNPVEYYLDKEISSK
jgi:rhodanese-related sulfurtransferase